MSLKKGIGIILFCIGTCSLTLEVLVLNTYRSTVGISLSGVLFCADALLSYIVPVIWIIAGTYLIIKDCKNFKD